MKRAIVLLLLSVGLAGCSSANLNKAETNTRLASFVPGGEIIHFPIWMASVIAGNPEVKLTEEDKANIIESVRNARSRMPECIEWPEYKFGYVCPMDEDWDEINAQIKTHQKQQTTTRPAAETPAD